MSAGFQAFGRCFFWWGGFSKLPQVGDTIPSLSSSSLGRSTEFNLDVQSIEPATKQ